MQRRWLLSVCAALIVGATAGCAALDAQQREWIFQPSDRQRTPGVSMDGITEQWLDFHSAETGKDERLHALWLPAVKKDAPLLLYLHGARWSVKGSLNRVRRMQSLGFSVLAVEYRGFGQSSAGLPSEATAREDALAAWQWLAQQHPETPRYLFGHSLGGAIAIDLASLVNDERGVMVEGTFPSIAAVVRTFKWGWLPVGPFITQRFESARKATAIGSPLLVVHGSDDQLIPLRLGRALYDAAAEPKRWVEVPGGTHHNTQALGMGAYRNALQELFALRSPLPVPVPVAAPARLKP